MAISTHTRQTKKKLNLVIDWGNSSLKTAWFDDDLLVETGRYASSEDLLNALENQAVGHVLVSSTSQSADAIRRQLMHVAANFLVLTSQTLVPIRNAYDTPATLGADRLAAAVGATALFPGQTCLVLDLGTCLTADLIDQEAVFQGGLISPGVRMRFRAMHEQTARLPLVATPGEWLDVQTKNTQQAMQSGVMNGLLFEINGIIETYRQKYPTIVVLACGGDMPAFESRLKPPIFAVPELVLIGLNRILRYNVENVQANTPDITT